MTPVEIRLQMTIRMRPDQVDQYRLEHDLDNTASIRDHIRTLLATELDGLGADWWHVTIT